MAGIVALFGCAGVLFLFFASRTVYLGNRARAGSREARVAAHKASARVLLLFVAALGIALPTVIEPMVRAKVGGAAPPLLHFHLGLIAASFVLLIVLMRITGLKKPALHRILGWIYAATGCGILLTGSTLLWMLAKQ